MAMTSAPMRKQAHLLLGGLLLLCLPTLGAAATLWVGAAEIDITPDRGVGLAGNYTSRISREHATPIVATALAIEARGGEARDHRLLVVSCDLVAIRDGVQERFRARLAPRLPGLDMRHVLLTATHTHHAPITTELATKWYLYEVPAEAGVMTPDEYMDFLLTRLADVAVAAWKNLAPAGVSWTLGHAVLGENRRAVYVDGEAVMSGKTNDARFRRLEGPSDNAVETLFFWGADSVLKAVAINVASPAQAAAGSELNADFWHDVRVQMRQRLDRPDLAILGWTGAGGDQLPRAQYRQAAEARMLKLRGLTRQQEIGRRITNAVVDTLDIARAEIRRDVPFRHEVHDIKLPPRRILLREYEASQAGILRLKARGDVFSRTMLQRERDILRRYENADAEPDYPMELHVVRIGDIAIATNPFELFTEYGIQIKARSPALQTFIIQHACNAGLYLPTERAIEGGGYSGLPHTNLVGPEGGQRLVDRSVAAIAALWP